MESIKLSDVIVSEKEFVKLKWSENFSLNETILIKRASNVNFCIQIITGKVTDKLKWPQRRQTVEFKVSAKMVFINT